MGKIKHQLRFAFLVLWLGAMTSVSPQSSHGQDSAPAIATLELRNDLHVLTTNPGTAVAGNVLVSTGPDGTFVIDDKVEELSDALLDVIQRIGGDRAVRMVANTHWHFDHVGGNRALGGAGAVIVAHDNARQRMSQDQVIEGAGIEVPASPPEALPLLTFPDQLTVHMNGYEVRATHHPHAYTDGDIVLDFGEANVIHMGDIFIMDGYPFIDVGSGGSIDGYIRALTKVLRKCKPDTVIVPGHGPVSTPADMKAYLDMLKTVRKRVQRGIDTGRELDAIVAMEPTREYDAERASDFLDGAAFVTLVYNSLTSTPPPPRLAHHHHAHHHRD